MQAGRGYGLGGAKFGPPSQSEELDRRFPKLGLNSRNTVFFRTILAYRDKE